MGENEDGGGISQGLLRRSGGGIPQDSYIRIVLVGVDRETDAFFFSLWQIKPVVLALVFHLYVGFLRIGCIGKRSDAVM